jgi:hypothetical protein
MRWILRGMILNTMLQSVLMSFLAAYLFQNGNCRYIQCYRVSCSLYKYLTRFYSGRRDFPALRKLGQEKEAVRSKHWHAFDKVALWSFNTSQYSDQLCDKGQSLCIHPSKCAIKECLSFSVHKWFFGLLVECGNAK